jgi:hypothetical protein
MAQLTGMDKSSFNGTRKDACFRPLQLVQSSSLPHLACCTNVNSLCTPRCSQTAGALHLFCISIAASLLDVVYHLLSAAALYDVCAIVFSMAEMTDNGILMNSSAAFVETHRSIVFFIFFRLRSSCVMSTMLSRPPRSRGHVRLVRSIITHTCFASVCLLFVSHRHQSISSNFRFACMHFVTQRQQTRFFPCQPFCPIHLSSRPTRRSACGQPTRRNRRARFFDFAVVAPCMATRCCHSASLVSACSPVQALSGTAVVLCVSSCFRRQLIKDSPNKSTFVYDCIIANAYAYDAWIKSPYVHRRIRFG